MEVFAEKFGVHVAYVPVAVSPDLFAIVEARGGDEAGIAQVREYVVHRPILDCFSIVHESIMDGLTLQQRTGWSVFPLTAECFNHLSREALIHRIPSLEFSLTERLTTLPE